MGDIRRRALLRSRGDETEDVGYLPGVYAYYSNGTLKTYEEADSSAIGVAVISLKCQFVMDKTNALSSSTKYGGYNKDLSSTAVTTTVIATAQADYRGEQNTTNIISALSGYTDSQGIVGAPATEACRAKFGGLGYMGALGEWQEAYNNKSAVDSMMSKIGGTAITNGYYWISTHYDNLYYSYALYWLNGTKSRSSRSSGSPYVRAFLKIEVPVIDYVDLGLPSGTLWCTGNIYKDVGGEYHVGEPTDNGCYYSWGNIEGHNRGEGYSFDSNTYNSTPGASLTANIASNDALHDAALACLGTGYRMPTKAEFDELKDNCTATWVTSYNGVAVAGRVFKSKKAGYTDAEIFIPASGDYNGTTIDGEGSSGVYLSSTYYSGTNAQLLIFSSNSINTNRDGRRYGCTVRAVKSK